MGQKVNPVGLRLGINRTWDSRWYSGKSEYGQLLHEDMKIREELMKDLKQAAVSKIVIERPHKKCRVTVQSARPGVVIGKKGADIEKLRRKVAKLTKSDVVINIVEIRKPELDAQLVAESIAPTPRPYRGKRARWADHRRIPVVPKRVRAAGDPPPSRRPRRSSSARTDRPPSRGSAGRCSSRR